MKNLENYGVQELNAREIQETDGGFLGLVFGVLIGLTVLGIHDSIEYPEAFIDGLIPG